jgi:hypothetical protein
MTVFDQDSHGEPVEGPEETGPGDRSGGSVATPRARVRRVFSGSRDLVRIVYRDPEHISERLTLHAVERLSDPAREWAQTAQRAHPERGRAELAELLRIDSARVARIDGAISGTPFLIALAPGYLTYLWQEMRMTLRTAALYGRDPADPRTAAEMLALRGVHPNVETAQAALSAVRDTRMPVRPTQRRSLRLWVHSVYVLLVFGGFMSPSTAERRSGILGWLRIAFGLLVGGVIWVITWVLPLTFMIAMAWGCESHTRDLGRRTLFFYDGDAATMTAAIRKADRHQDRGHKLRASVRAIALFLSVAVPIAFVAYVNHMRSEVGISWLGALGGLVALSLVIATAVVSSRR